jgi:hypothetical protein
MSSLHFSKNLGKYFKGLNNEFSPFVIHQFVFKKKNGMFDYSKWKNKITKHIPQNIFYETAFKGETSIDLIIYGDREEYKKQQEEERKAIWNGSLFGVEPHEETKTLKFDRDLNEYVYSVHIIKKRGIFNMSSWKTKYVSEEQEARHKIILEEKQKQAIKEMEEQRKKDMERRQAQLKWLEEGIQKYKDDQELIRKEQLEYWKEFTDKKRQTKKEFEERIYHIGIRLTNIGRMKVKVMKEKWIPKITEDIKTQDFSENTMKWWFNQNNTFDGERIPK